MKKIKEITRPSFRLVRNSEHYNYHVNVLKTITPIIAKNYNMEDHRFAYEKLFRKEDEAFTRNRAFEETKDIQIADQKRDELFFFIKRFIENMKYNPDPQLKAAGINLDEALEPYRNAHRKSFQENTLLIDSFVKEMEENEVRFKSLEHLDLIRPLELLKAANESFRTLYNERSKKRHQRNMKEKLKQLRPQVDQAFFEVVKFINAVYLVSCEITKEKQVMEELEDIIDKINAFTMEMLDSIAKRRMKKDGDDEQD
jgi:glutamate synthase domain-containing protein 2